MLKFHRGERLAQVKRLKNKRKNYYGYGRAYGTEGKKRMNAHQLGKVSQYPAMCSCHMCGNNRKFYGNSSTALTLSENSFIQLAKTEV